MNAGVMILVLLAVVSKLYSALWWLNQKMLVGHFVQLDMKHVASERNLDRMKVEQ